jgi:hypothetical protein
VMLASKEPLKAPVVLWMLSAAAFAVLFAMGELDVSNGFARGELDRAEVLYLGPVCVLGFVLCPHLDMTFHAAAQGAGQSRRAAFTLGFGVLFSVMVLFTLGYAHMFGTRPLLSVGGPRWVLGVVLAHVAAQLTYTTVLHHRYLQASRATHRARLPGAYAGAITVAVALGALSPRIGWAWGLSAGELIYRGFMGFYGLVFPAYVWICMIPRRGVSGPTRGAVRVWALAVGIALPMFAMGFLARQSFWLGPGVLVVLLARLMVTREGIKAAAGRRSA